MIALAAFASALTFQTHPQIAVFPVVDKTGERDLEFSKKLVTDARTYLGGKFTQGEYDLLDEKKVDAGLLAAKFDSNDRDQWVTSNLIELGKKLKAPKLVFAVIAESTSGDSNAFFSLGGGATGLVKVRMWLIDVDSNKAILKGVTVEGKSSTNAFGDLSGSKARIIRAIQIAFDKGLNDLLNNKKK